MHYIDQSIHIYSTVDAIKYIDTFLLMMFFVVFFVYQETKTDMCVLNIKRLIFFNANKAKNKFYEDIFRVSL